MVLCPIIVAISEFKTSKLQQANINPFFLPFWMNFAMVVVTGVVILVLGLPMPQKWATYWCILLWACLSLAALITKMIAFSNDKVTRVYPIYYFEAVYCLMLDVWVYNVQFNWL